jgi:hypothetical protein
MALSETPEDSARIVAIKEPIGTKLVREDLLVDDNVGATGPGDKLPGLIAHQGPVLVLHSHAPIGVDKRNMYKGQDVSMKTSRQQGLGDQGAPGSLPWPE